jgi:hypothetical protein
MTQKTKRKLAPKKKIPLFLEDRSIYNNEDTSHYYYCGDSGVSDIFSYESGLFFGTASAVKTFYNNCHNEAKIAYTKEYKHSNRYRNFVDYINKCDADDAKQILQCADMLDTSTINFSPKKADDSRSNSIKLIDDCFKSVLLETIDRNLHRDVFSSLESNHKIALCKSLSQTYDEQSTSFSDENYTPIKKVITSRYNYFTSEVEDIFERCEEMQDNEKRNKKESEKNNKELTFYEQKKNIDIEAKMRILDLERQFMEVTQKIAQEQDADLRKLQQDQADFYFKQITQMKELLKS